MNKLYLLCLALIFSSCATISGGSQYLLTVIPPDQATIQIDQERVAERTVLQRYRQVPIQGKVMYSNDSLEEQHFTVYQKVRAGSLVIGALTTTLISPLIDLITWAIYEPDYTAHPYLTKESNTSFLLDATYFNATNADSKPALSILSFEPGTVNAVIKSKDNSEERPIKFNDLGYAFLFSDPRLEPNSSRARLEIVDLNGKSYTYSGYYSSRDGGLQIENDEYGEIAGLIKSNKLARFYIIIYYSRANAYYYSFR